MMLLCDIFCFSLLLLPRGWVSGWAGGGIQIGSERWAWAWQQNLDVIFPQSSWTILMATKGRKSTSIIYYAIHIYCGI